MSVRVSCLALEVSRSGFYSWYNRPESERQRENKALLVGIRRIHKESRGTYGLPRIHEKLKEVGQKVGKNRVSRLMKKTGISGLICKRFKVKTTDSNHDLPIAPRIFQTEEPVTHPVKANEAWAGDISYISTDEGFLYLATYVDLFTRKVVGFAMADHMKMDLITEALEMALRRQPWTPGALLTHSDRGSQYASEGYRESLKTRKITVSMSRRGNCYDNAFAESFFATLKKELIYRKNFKNREEAKKSIFEYIEVWYNRRRLHSSIGYQTPVQFEESLAS